MQSGAGPAFAGSEGSGFSLEKPPPEAENRPGYPESPVFAPPAQGLAKSQAGTPQSATLPAPLSGEPLAGTHSPGVSPRRFCVPPSSTASRSPFPKGKVSWLPTGGIRIRPGFLCVGSAYRPHPPLRGPPSPRGRFLGFQPGVCEFARGFSAPVLRTDVFMVRLPQAIVYWNSLRGAPPLICRLRAAPSPEGEVGSIRTHVRET